ncbi:MAG: prephenate dehydrogenase/arogenate dehydrogenase family protein [bacterium]|nr:prephenate dehydrogenase/arogenate dehydrogenase family protein [bacterium]
MRRAAIFGTGLIGASLGMALRRVGWTVAGWDPDPAALEVATERGALDDPCESREDALEGSELVVLAGPLTATLETISGLRTEALVTDVAGVKGPVVDARPAGMRLVAGHPMAGREQAGPAAASPSLFKGAAWVICPDHAVADDVEALESIVESVGATPYRLSAAEHDQVVADISHLPQILAVSLINLITRRDPAAVRLVAGSFRDLTRVAASEPRWWPEVLAANEANVRDSIGRLVRLLEEVRAEVADGASGPLSTRIEEARTKRQAMAPPVVRVGVVLQDRPGEIARVGRALERSGVDVRDLQLRHALHGGGGILTLSVRPSEADLLRAALLEADFSLE